MPREPRFLALWLRFPAGVAPRARRSGFVRQEAGKLIKSLRCRSLADSADLIPLRARRELELRKIEIENVRDVRDGTGGRNAAALTFDAAMLEAHRFQFGFCELDRIALPTSRNEQHRRQSRNLYASSLSAAVNLFSPPGQVLELRAETTGEIFALRLSRRSRLKILESDHSILIFSGVR